MSLIFVDSWDHYDTAQITQKWDTKGADTGIDTTPGVPRTGRGCLRIISAAFGPARTFPANVSGVLMVGTAHWSDLTGGLILGFQNLDYASGFDGMMLSVKVTATQALQVDFHPAGSGFVVGKTANNVFRLNQWNTVALSAQSSANSEVNLWCNGVLVGHWTGVNMFATNYNKPYWTGVQLMAEGGTPLAYHDDTWAFDCSSSPNDSFPGAVRIYSEVPTANGAPVAWTPSAGQNFQCVDEIPPNTTDFVSSGVVGAQDQYVYGVTAVPAASRILAVQHVLDMNVDSGARSVGSSAGGVVSSGHPLTTTYGMYLFPYDTNPLTSSAWALADFPFQFGPDVTA